MEPTRIGDRLFVDGVTRDVFGPGPPPVCSRYDGKPVYGVWIYIPEPDSIIVFGPKPTDQ
jgi:hypothetical protein